MELKMKKEKEIRFYVITKNKIINNLQYDIYICLYDHLYAYEILTQNHLNLMEIIYYFYILLLYYLFFLLIHIYMF